jgi:hypothetical protein
VEAGFRFVAGEVIVVLFEEFVNGDGFLAAWTVPSDADWSH